MTDQTTFEVMARDERIKELEAERDALIARVAELEGTLSRIIDDLPSSRDWLDPVLEKQARAALARYRGE